jgi:hypothetical protein
MAIQQTFDFLATADVAATAPQRPGLAEARRSPKRALEASQPAVAAPPLIDQLRAAAKCIHVSSTSNQQPRVSTGSPLIDRLLPGGGLRTDAITEWVAQRDGCGAAALAMITAATRLQQIPGPLVVISSPDQFYPPAAVALGIPAERIIWVRPPRRADGVWAIDQALRSPATAVVWAPVDARLDDRDARRFQLAAETGKTLGLFIRPAAVRGRPTFAEVRFHVSGEIERRAAASSAKTVRVSLDRCRGGQIGQSVLVQLTPPTPSHQDEATPLPLAAQLARPRQSPPAAARHRA